MLLLLLLLALSSGHRVTESVEDLPPEAFNTTTLYPVNGPGVAGSPGTANGTGSPNRSETANATSATRVKTEATGWKLEAAFGESKFDEKESNQDEKEVSTTAAPTPSQETPKKNSSAEFRPSRPLGTFIEDDNFSLEVIPTKASFGDFRPLKKPPSGFINFPKDNFKANFYYNPKESIKSHKFPYKIESGITTGAKQSWRPADPLDSKPTMESPMRVPAGSLYKAPDAFKDKPVSDEDFGLSFDDLKDNNNIDVKKRVNPWKNLLRLVTAFIPVGLIISALTPNVITLHSTGPGPDNGYPPQLYRRSDKTSELTAISEPCRRRLLCELHSENNYNQSPQAGRRRRHCYRLHCEEPEALARMLQWLLSHSSDQRGQHFT